MKRWTAASLALVLMALAPLLAERQPDEEEQRALRQRVEQRFDVVPLTAGVALTPKRKTADVRLIEISDVGIAINGVPVTGRELRDRLGPDATMILQVSYLDAEGRRALFARQPPRDVPLERGVGAPAPPSAPAPLPPAVPRRDGRAEDRTQRSSGDRVRVFGSVEVPRGDEITGQVVAVFGSVKIDGTVGDQVVAVLGGVELGPNAIVRGDVVSVGGRVRRAPGAQVRGGVTEVSLANVPLQMSGDPWGDGWRPYHMFDVFGALPRLFGSAMRFVLLVLLAWVAYLIARSTVEASAERVSDNPVKAAFIGLLAQLLLLPLLLLTCIVLAISIIGIPLLLLVPFVILLLLAMAVAGFASSSYAVGRWGLRRLGVPPSSPYAVIAVGIFIVLLPLLVGRLFGLAGFPAAPVAWMFVALGVVIEFVTWSSGFGAVINNSFVRWQARRGVREPLPAPPVA